jgi:hypothetical protein
VASMRLWYIVSSCSSVNSGTEAAISCSSAIVSAQPVFPPECSVETIRTLPSTRLDCKSAFLSSSCCRRASSRFSSLSRRNSLSERFRTILSRFIIRFALTDEHAALVVDSAALFAKVVGRGGAAWAAVWRLVDAAAAEALRVSGSVQRAAENIADKHNEL